MDKENLHKIWCLLNEVLDENEPSDEELDYNEDLIELYAALHNLRECFFNIGW